MSSSTTSGRTLRAASSAAAAVVRDRAPRGPWCRAPSAASRRRRRCRRRPARGAGGAAHGARAPRGALAPAARAASRDRQAHGELGCPGRRPSLRASTRPPCSSTRRAPARGRCRARPASAVERRRLGEHVEDARQHLGRDADAVVAHADSDLVAVARARVERDVAARVGVLGGVGRAGWRSPARGAPGRRRRRAARRGRSSARAVAARARAAGRAVSIARRDRPTARSARSRRSSILPRVMRETSSRSSTRRTICVDLALHDRRAPARLRLAGVAPRAGAASALRIGASGLRSSWREHGEELVLAAVGRPRAPARRACAR